MRPIGDRPIRGAHWTASAWAYHWKAVRRWQGSLYLATRPASSDTTDH